MNYYMDNDSTQKDHLKRSNKEAEYDKMQNTAMSKKVLERFRAKPYQMTTPKKGEKKWEQQEK